MVLRKGVALATAAGVLMSAPAAVAQTESGVTVDPQSPAGKEYALPIDRARRDATGLADKAPGGTPAPAFGAGVKPDAAPARRAPQSTRRPSPGRTSAPEASGSGAATQSDARAPTASAVKQESRNVDRELVRAGVSTHDDDGGGLALLLGGVALAVVGAAAGLLVRHRTA